MGGFTMTISNSGKPKKGKTRVNITRLSHATGYSKSHISRVFSRETKPSVDCLVKLAQAMGIEIGTLHEKIKGRKFNVNKTC